MEFLQNKSFSSKWKVLQGPWNAYGRGPNEILDNSELINNNIEITVQPYWFTV